MPCLRAGDVTRGENRERSSRKKRSGEERYRISDEASILLEPSVMNTVDLLGYVSE